ncbi:MAG: heterocyst development glycosyltransferase HepC [Leptolyngbyaceae bacterium]|nr:heterocyst development glycosyltransferase HepC [Leptolyngbyaceae bacterium]
MVSSTLSPHTDIEDNGVTSQLPRHENTVIHPYCLKKREQTLLVQTSLFPSLQDTDISVGVESDLFSYLKKLSIHCVYIDPEIGEAHLSFWNELCQQVDLPLYLQLPEGDYPANLSPRFWKIKRVLDWFAALVLIIVLSPLLLCIAILIPINSSGEVFYKQWRVGYEGRLFKMWKFRTMVADAETLHQQILGHQDGLHKHCNDPRMTSMGRSLRKYSLDELPQLFNVLRGEMSLVGPRPWALYDAVRIPTSLQGRLRAMPGITGEWQVNGRSHLRDIVQVTQCDLEYLRTWSIIRDLKLLLLTIPKVLLGIGAY